MIFSEKNMRGRSDVMVVSSGSGPPRLDLTLTQGRRGTFDSLNSDFERSFYPRTTQSSNDLFTQALDSMDMTDCESEWGAVRARARGNSDRAGLADLIDFLRTTSPPADFPSQSVFDDDTTEPQEQPEKWGLFKKLRRPRTRARSESPTRRPLTAGLPNSAVASKTSSGKPHIAISIPLEYCHVGPDSDWALAIFNATPPLPPTPPVRMSDEENRNGVGRPYTSDRAVTVLKTVSEKGSISTLNTVNTMSTRRGTKGSVSIWPKINPHPMSPPMTPYTTPPGSLRETSSTKKKQNRMPPQPQQYAELAADPVPAGRRPSGSLDKGYYFGRNEGSLVQTTDASLRKPKAKPAPKRPDNITLPPRRSSIKIVKPQAGHVPDSQQSIDGMIDSDLRRQNVASDAPQLSPAAYSESHSISPSITTDLSEPVVSSARSAKTYSMASITRPEMPSMTPRQSYIARPGSGDTMQTTLVGESLASRNASTRTATSMQSRKERVKSLKQRDMEALKAKKKQQAEQDEDGEVTPRPRTCGTAISSLRLPSRDGTFGSNDDFPMHGVETKLSATNLANMAKSHQRSSDHVSHGTAIKISHWQATQETETPGWETAREELTPGWETAQETPTIDWEKTPLLLETTEDQRDSATIGTETFGNGDIRDSTLSSEPPRRWGSLHRASWASSVPLLDRIGSFAPSDASATQVADTGSSPLPLCRAQMSRADSATLSQADVDRLYLNRFSFYDFDNQVRMDPTEDDQSIAGSIAAFPKPGSGAGPRLSAIMPVAEVVPSAPIDERWSASTLNSPMTVIEVPHQSFADGQTSRQSSPQVTRLHTASNTSPARLNASRDHRQTNGKTKLGPVRVAVDADEAATLRANSRLREEDSIGFPNMAARELRNHYASLRSARVNDLAHEMLLNQERLEIRMHQQERNQMLFIERLEKCMTHQTGPEA
ncbi:uncharacterized protein ColSpa_02660 [Colletotrichum spaethianum]|uniref:Uncharacterized protein n=1 Tax=Colletotrichum spaethianum TaxID=700344 RepID=A0AA37L9G8_9PEZI|nr:uncharacterized protein ColSpa_02660 [Colletotrichum spaethianum]GKT42479.1 hypothetical protein ColSpa_02660 [Colletotrichum spaethianum]